MGLGGLVGLRYQPQYETPLFSLFGSQCALNLTQVCRFSQLWKALSKAVLAKEKLASRVHFLVLRTYVHAVERVGHCVALL